MIMAPGIHLLLLLLLPPGLLHASEPTPEATPEPCEVDDDIVRCFCNFTGPDPEWSSALQCLGASEVEIRGGGRDLKEFLKHADIDPQQYVNTLRALRLRRLTVGAARVPGLIMVRVLRALGFSRLQELTLEDLEITGNLPPPVLENRGPALSTLRLRNVSWAPGGDWLAHLQQWLKPGLKVLRIAQAHSPAFSCAQLGAFPTLTNLDLSDSPGLGERGLIETLCPHKFPALQDLGLRNAGLETPSGVCTALAAAGVQPQHLDLSHNALRTTVPAAPACTWPSTLTSLNLSFAGLEQVPKGLPAQLSVLDLRCNRLNRAPSQRELPKVSNLLLDGNPYLDPEALTQQEDLKNSAKVSAGVRWALTAGLSGALALLPAGRVFF
ncbi:PREDICTED: monocyte differentiation antigen CD14 [Condylura cristata]|uniref:monocyte differentiation antigen CD14 n=1 Tax=Condylura cristata TaxID=143302 RepID=UPI000334426F|nr:PREDICTED: monocyte differentiation antigen CD14 [Condylura cristata]